MDTIQLDAVSANGNKQPSAKSQQIHDPDVSATISMLDDDTAIADHRQDTDRNYVSYDLNTDHEHNHTIIISSLQNQISNLVHHMEQMQSEYNVMESEYKLCVMENAILREFESRFDNKSIEYDTLRQQYNELEIELSSTNKASKAYLNQNQELQIQKDQLMTRYQHIETENIDHQREINKLKQIRETLSDDIISLNDAMNDSQRELLTIKHINAEEHMHQIALFRDEIKRLNNKIENLNKMNNELKRFQETDSRERDSFGENETNESDKTSSISRKAAYSSITEDMEECMVDIDTHNMSHAQYMVTDSLWHDIDIQLIKMESLLISNANMRHILDVNAPEHNEEEKSIEYSLEDDIRKLPQRLGRIYNELHSNDNMEDMKDRYENIIGLKDANIDNLMNKMEEIKIQKDILKRDLINVQSLYEGYKIQSRSCLNEYKHRIESMSHSKLKWETQVRTYGVPLLMVLLFLYLLYRYKGTRNSRVRRALQIMFGWIVKSN